MTPRVPPEHWGEVAALYVRCRDGMVAFAGRLLGDDRHAAHDVVQEVFQAAALKWGVLRGYAESRRRAWLYRVLKNKVFDQWGAIRRAGVGLLDEDSAADLDTPRTAVSRLLLQRCWKVIDGMPCAQRRVALLKWQGEWSNREIGDHLGIAQSTVRVHLKNARGTLVAELGDEVVFPSEWHDEQRHDEDQEDQGEEARHG